MVASYIHTYISYISDNEVHTHTHIHIHIKYTYSYTIKPKLGNKKKYKNEVNMH